MKKIYAFLSNTFYYRTRIYYIYDTKENVLKRLNELFDKEYGFFLDKNTSSINGDNFKMTQKTWNYLSFIPESQLAYLKGIVYAEEQNKIKITVSIRPNIFFGVWFTIFLVLGIAYIYQYYSRPAMSDALFWGLLMFIIAIPITIGLARVFSLSFLDKFEIFMNLKSYKNQ